MIVCFLILGGLTVLFILSASIKSDKKGLLKAFDRMSRYAVMQMTKRGRGNNMLLTQAEDEISMLQPAGDSRAAAREELTKLISTGLLLLFSGTVLSLLLGIQSLQKSGLPDGVYLERGTYGEGSREEKLKVRGQGEETERTVTVPVEERKYTDKEIEKLFLKAEKELEQIVPGGNRSLDEVREDLNLPQELPDYTDCPVKISWQCDNYEVMDDSGHLTGKGTNEKGVLVNLQARLSYFETVRILSFGARVYPMKLSPQQNWMKKLRKLINKNDRQTETKERMELPEELDGKRLLWSREEDQSFGMVLFLTLLAAVLVPAGKWRERKKQIQDRKHQMLSDYPDVVNKLVLFLGAGMTVGGAFRRLSEEYEQRKKEAGKDGTTPKGIGKKDAAGMRYAYEEMGITLRELESGVPEGKAYENFGSRCRVQEYLKLGALLSQNLKKGTKDLTNMLEREAREAFEARKRLARKQGEEAGTKMLVPMVMMLAVVLMIVTVPAFASFGI